MPLLKIHTNVSPSSPSSLAADLCQEVGTMLGKPASYVMVVLETGQPVAFGGTNDPCIYAELKSLGLDENRTTGYSSHLCGLLGEALGVPANRIYIEFTNGERHLWGWDSRTF